MCQTIGQLKEKYNASTEEELFAILTERLLFCSKYLPEWVFETQTDFIDLIKNH